jgi:hypothetical protein
LFQQKGKTMPNDVTPGGGANQNQKEKKDAQQHPNGRSEQSDFEDPQANQAKGHRKHPASAHAEHSRSAQPNPPAGPTNNTTSGGNRPKEPQTTDHN